MIRGRQLILALVSSAFAWQAGAAELAFSASFESVEAFVVIVKSFQPLAAKGEMAALFSMPESGQKEAPQTGKLVTAPSVASCRALWSDESHTLIFATASPPTEATRSVAGVLFLLRHNGAVWQITDHLRFTAIGKYADISAELTADTGSGYTLGKDGMPPVVTLKESQGGRGYSRQLSASYTFEKSHLKRLELE